MPFGHRRRGRFGSPGRPACCGSCRTRTYCSRCRAGSVHGRFIRFKYAVVARIASCLLGDHAKAGRVVILPGNQPGSRGGAQRRGEHAVVAKTFVGDPIHRWRRDHATEGARHAETGSSVIIKSTLGAPFGGTTRGAHHGLDRSAPSLISPPNLETGGGICSPPRVVVALGEPGTPVVCCARAGERNKPLATAVANRREAVFNFNLWVPINSAGGRQLFWVSATVQGVLG